MAIYIALQTPTVEIPVTSGKDCTGTKAELTAEFRRYPSDQADKLIAEFDANMNDKESDSAVVVAKMRSFIKGQIVALKDIPLIKVDDLTGKQTPWKLDSTRNAKDEEALWGSAENCLDFLLDMLLDSTPWSASLISAMYAALTNMNLGADAETKNS